jgi:hypothetical protein
MPVTSVTLSRTPDGVPVLLADVTADVQAEEYPIKASELSLPGSPAEITSSWLPDVSPAAKELAWLLLDIVRQAGHWGTVTVTHVAVHMLTDSRRSASARIGFQHHPIRGSDDWAMLAIFRNASQELADSGYVVHNSGHTTMSPTLKLVTAVSD